MAPPKARSGSSSSNRRKRPRMIASPLELQNRLSLEQRQELEAGWSLMEAAIQQMRAEGQLPADTGRIGGSHRYTANGSRSSMNNREFMENVYESDAIPDDGSTAEAGETNEENPDDDNDQWIDINDFPHATVPKATQTAHSARKRALFENWKALRFYTVQRLVAHSWPNLEGKACKYPDCSVRDASVLIRCIHCRYSGNESIFCTDHVQYHSLAHKLVDRSGKHFVQPQRRRSCCDRQTNRASTIVTLLHTWEGVEDTEFSYCDKHSIFYVLIESGFFPGSPQSP
ncbi:hypothetical protein HDU99_004675, partial [Rhizoclosmatium hyalinum]